MKIRIAINLLSLVFLLTGGCKQEKKCISIISEPEGARIEINDNYVGNTPIQVMIPVWRGNFTRDSNISAFPIHTGEHMQNKFFTDDEEVPDRIFFDMKNIHKFQKNVTLKYLIFHPCTYKQKSDS